MIEANRLVSNRTVFAYDLAWEPHFEGKKDFAHYAEEWRKWVEKEYGGLQAAYDRWSWDTTPVERGPLPIPEGRWWFQSGPWDPLMFDYYSFFGQLVSEKYGRAYQLVHSVYPNHAVSFRMWFAGDPTYQGPEWVPFQMEFVSNAVDIMEPEAYGRIGDWDRVKPGIFTVAYARAVAPQHPVMWAEMGQSAWDPAAGSTTGESLETVARFYRDFHRMLLRSESDGVVFWWYPGGYRTNERSDYGIINPDGTDRPVTQVIRELGPEFRHQGFHSKPDVILPIEVKWRPGGISGLYKEIKKDFWKHVDSGMMVALQVTTDREEDGAVATQRGSSKTYHVEKRQPLKPHRTTKKGHTRSNPCTLCQTFFDSVVSVLFH